MFLSSAWQRLLGFLAYTLFLLYVGVSYLIISVYVAAPFTLIGDDIVALPNVFTAVDWAIIAMFAVYVVLGVLSRTPFVSTHIVAIGYVALLAALLLTAVGALVMSWTCPDGAMEQYYASRGTGALGAGWLLLLYVIHSSRGTAMRVTGNGT